MTTAVGTDATSNAAQLKQSAVADVFVVFGISGDLAKVMTFNSLYRLEARGLLDCPIIGVASNDWSVEDLRAHARSAIEACGSMIDDEVFNRFSARLSYLSGDFADAGTYQSVARAVGEARCPSSTWRSRRSCSAPSSRDSRRRV